MITALGFVFLAATGSVARCVIGRRLNVHDGFPFGTLFVNLAGSVGLGLLHEVEAPVSTMLGVGLLGAFTTFSSFARDAVALAERRRLAMAAIYVGVSVGGAVLGAAAGVALAP